MVKTANYYYKVYKVDEFAHRKLHCECTSIQQVSCMTFMSEHKVKQLIMGALIPEMKKWSIDSNYVKNNKVRNYKYQYMLYRIEDDKKIYIGKYNTTKEMAEKNELIHEQLSKLLVGRKTRYYGKYFIIQIEL